MNELVWFGTFACAIRFCLEAAGILTVPGRFVNSFDHFFVHYIRRPKRAAALTAMPRPSQTQRDQASRRAPARLLRRVRREHWGRRDRGPKIFPSGEEFLFPISSAFVGAPATRKWAPQFPTLEEIWRNRAAVCRTAARKPPHINPSNAETKVHGRTSHQLALHPKRAAAGRIQAGRVCLCPPQLHPMALFGRQTQVKSLVDYGFLIAGAGCSIAAAPSSAYGGSASPILPLGDCEYALRSDPWLRSVFIGAAALLRRCRPCSATPCGAPALHREPQKRAAANCRPVEIAGGRCGRKAGR